MINRKTIAIIAKKGIDTDFMAAVGVSGELIVHSIAKTTMIPMRSAVTDGGMDDVNETAI